jgi:hypothetical protein
MLVINVKLFLVGDLGLFGLKLGELGFYILLGLFNEGISVIFLDYF